MKHLDIHINKYGIVVGYLTKEEFDYFAKILGITK